MDYLIRFEVASIAAGAGLACVAMRIYRPNDEKNVVYTIDSFSSGGFIASLVATDWIYVPCTVGMPVLTAPRALLGGYSLAIDIKKNVLSVSGAPNDIQVTLDSPGKEKNGPPVRIFDVTQINTDCWGYAVGGFKTDGILYGGYLRGESLQEGGVF